MISVKEMPMDSTVALDPGGGERVVGQFGCVPRDARALVVGNRAAPGPHHGVGAHDDRTGRAGLACRLRNRPRSMVVNCATDMVC
jgi:hypothetical protein